MITEQNNRPMVEIAPPDMTDDEIIEANRRAYDRMDKNEERNERKNEVAGKVLGKIKNIKKMVKDRVRSQVDKQLELQERFENGE